MKLKEIYIFQLSYFDLKTSEKAFPVKYAKIRLLFVFLRD